VWIAYNDTLTGTAWAGRWPNPLTAPTQKTWYSYQAGIAGKFACVWDEKRQRLIYWGHRNTPLVYFGASGSQQISWPLWGGTDPVEYTHIGINPDGTSYDLAWTTIVNGLVSYKGNYYASYPASAGKFLPYWMPGDDSGNGLRLNPSLTTNTFLTSVLVDGDDIHATAWTVPQTAMRCFPNPADCVVSYSRWSRSTGTRTLFYQPLVADGFTPTMGASVGHILAKRGGVLYFVGAVGNKLFTLASPDAGVSWSLYSTYTDPAWAVPNWNSSHCFYTVSGEAQGDSSPDILGTVSILAMSCAAWAAASTGIQAASTMVFRFTP
jgi:hypothetical protein